MNVDNAAGGKGLTDTVADELLQLPINVMTAGNHIWQHKSIHSHLERSPILRPYNISGKHPGKGFSLIPSKKFGMVGVIHLQGKAYMPELKTVQTESPFPLVEDLVGKLRSETNVILVDVHAEATAEKRALGWLLDGKVTALFGTHTHVQTADEEILPKKTAYISDIGMTGPHQSVIGLDKEIAIKRFMSGGQYKKFEVASEGIRLEGIVLKVDVTTGEALSIRRIKEIA